MANRSNRRWKNPRMSRGAKPVEAIGIRRANSPLGPVHRLDRCCSQRPDIREQSYLTAREPECLQTRRGPYTDITLETRQLACATSKDLWTLWHRNLPSLKTAIDGKDLQRKLIVEANNKISGSSSYLGSNDWISIQQSICLCRCVDRSRKAISLVVVFTAQAELAFQEKAPRAVNADAAGPTQGEKPLIA